MAYLKELIEEWKRSAGDEQDETFEFLRWMKINLDSRRVDRVAGEVHERVFSRVDCTECGHCCTVMRPEVTAEDSRRIAAHLGVSEAEFAEKYLAREDGVLGVTSMKYLPCMFLKDKKCSIYDVRPEACRGFPWTDQPEFTSRTYAHAGNSVDCPAVYAIVKQLKREFRWRPRRRRGRR